MLLILCCDQLRGKLGCDVNYEDCAKGVRIHIERVASQKRVKWFISAFCP